MNLPISNPPNAVPNKKQLFKTPLDVPLVHTLYESYTLWNELILQFPKSQRYTLGQTCSQYLLKTMEQVLAAAATKIQIEKQSCIQAASTKLDTLKLLVRLCKDTKCITNVNYLKMESLLSSTGRMIGGWIKEAKKTNAKEGQ